jgi:hypothetical protein
MAQPLTDSILALTRYANETTGASDTTLSDAVETLVEGYGQGGGSVSQDAEGYIVLPADGGATMPFELLEEITVTEATRAVNIDTSGYLQNYQFLMVMADLTLSKNDYVYTSFNNDTPTTSGFTWLGESTEFHHPLLFVLRNWANAHFTVVKARVRAVETTTEVADVTNVYINTYSSDAMIAVGSKFTVYGAKYVEM